MAVPIQNRRITLGEFQRLAAAGEFLHDRVELIRGEIVEMAALGDPHAGCVRRLSSLFHARMGARFLVDAQHPVALELQESEPYPDVLILQPREDFYSTRRPAPGDVLLVIEVSDSSLRYDRKVKIPLYAESGIVEAWIVDLRSEAIFVHRRPVSGKYQEIREHRRGEVIEFEGESFAVDAILG